MLTLGEALKIPVNILETALSQSTLRLVGRYQKWLKTTRDLPIGKQRILCIQNKVAGLQLLNRTRIIETRDIEVGVEELNTYVSL